MAVLPTYNRQEDLNAIPGMAVHAAGDADSYGLSVAKAGTDLFNFGIKKAQEFEYAKAVSALNAFQKEIDDLHLDPDKGLYNTRKLGDANGMTVDAEASMNEIAAKYFSGLSSPYMKQIFSQQGQKIVFAQSRANQKWEAEQINAYKTQEANSAVTNAYNKIQLFYDDDEQVGIQREIIKQQMEYLLDGMGEETREAEFAKMESNIASIQALAIVKDRPLEAEAWLEENKDRFTPDMYEQVKKKVEAEARPFRLEVIRDEIVKRFGDDQQAAFSFIHKNYEGKDEKDIWQVVESYYTDRRRLKEQAQSDALKYYMNAIASAKSYGEAISIAQRWNGEPRLKQSLIDQAKHLFGVTNGSGTQGYDIRDYLAARTDAAALAEAIADMSPDEAQKARDKFLYKWAGKVRGSRLETLLNLFFPKKSTTAGKAGAAASDKTLTRTMNHNSDSLINDILKDSGYLYDPDALATFDSAFDRAIRDWEHEHPDKVMPEGERFRLAQDLITTQVKLGTHTDSFLWFDSDVYAPKMYTSWINSEKTAESLKREFGDDAVIHWDPNIGKHVVAVPLVKDGRTEWHVVKVIEQPRKGKR